MKHLIVVLALVVAGVTGAHAQAISSELYGNFRYTYALVDTGDDTRWASANNASRLGVRGDVSEGTLTGFYDLQVGVNVDAEQLGGAFTQRYYLAGIRGSFGALSLGRQSPEYKLTGLRLDPFYDTSTLSAGGGVPTTGLFAGASFGLSNLTNGFADRTLAYATPSFSGLTANAAVHIDTGSSHSLDLGAAYRANGIDAGLQYFSSGAGRTWVPSSGVDDAVRVHAVYRQAGSWSAGASFERVSTESDATQNFLYVAATAEPTSRMSIAGSFGYVSDSGAFHSVTGTGYHLGVFYQILRPVRIHALYSMVNPDEGPGRSAFAAGVIAAFAM